MYYVFDFLNVSFQMIVSPLFASVYSAKQMHCQLITDQVL